MVQPYKYNVKKRRSCRIFCQRRVRSLLSFLWLKGFSFLFGKCEMGRLFAVLYRRRGRSKKNVSGVA